MKSCFVDTNVFLRFLTTDDEGQHARAARLFHNAAAGKMALVTGPPVLFELAWTLKSAYGVERHKILELLSSLTSMPGLRLADAELVESAIALAQRTNQEFADAYILAQSQTLGADAVATFNRRHFQRLGAQLLDL